MTGTKSAGSWTQRPFRSLQLPLERVNTSDVEKIFINGRQRLAALGLENDLIVTLSCCGHALLHEDLHSRLVDHIQVVNSV